MNISPFLLGPSWFSLELVPIKINKARNQSLDSLASPITHTYASCTEECLCFSAAAAKNLIFTVANLSTVSRLRLLRVLFPRWDSTMLNTVCTQVCRGWRLLRCCLDSGIVTLRFLSSFVGQCLQNPWFFECRCSRDGDTRYPIPGIATLENSTLLYCTLKFLCCCSVSF